MIGQRIGSYTIVEKLGEGGMGVVYRATDSRLHRDVALKFIPEALAKDPQTMGRFEREAQVLASLNHPNIAAIYGLEENGGQRALVMELASGEELAARMLRGKIPLEEALRIALAIAEALEAAHDKGIIHRDLKPANIKLGANGDSGTGSKVKILDFGLAKALQGDLASSSSGIDLTRSPTLSVAATQAGMILGTAGYMSPEQARALPADRRADIWSFGVILYEMIAGRRTFTGDTVADTLAKVIERDPDWSHLPATTPPAIKSLIERCLVKSPRQRLQAIGDARLVIEETLANLARPLSSDRPAGTEPELGCGSDEERARIDRPLRAVGNRRGGCRGGGAGRVRRVAPDREAIASSRRCRSRSRSAPASSTSGWGRASRSPRTARSSSTSRATTSLASFSCASSIDWSPPSSTAATAGRPRRTTPSSRRTESGSGSSPRPSCARCRSRAAPR